jgi:hypothetical protein
MTTVRIYGVNAAMKDARRLMAGVARGCQP